MTLSEYIKRRNGVTIGHSNSLRNNLYRSLGGKNFSTFWNHWNPIFGYFLGKKVFKPLRRYFSVAISLTLTFIFCGLIHDFVTTLFRGKVSLFFAIWFLYMGLAVLLSRSVKQDLTGKIWLIRAISNIAIIASTFGFAMSTERFLTFSFGLF